MGKIILVVDIETTGYLKQGGKIVEIGIVKLNLETGGIKPVYSSLIKEPGLDISHTTGQFGWIFRNSNLTFDEVMMAPTLEEQRSVIQHILNLYEATAYNKAFDFGFLKDRGFQINELPCPMQLATPIMNIGGTMKWPRVEEAWEYFFGKTGYIEMHRALDDAIHEAKIVHKLYKMGQFIVSYECVKSKLLNYYREPGGHIVFVYEVIGTPEELALYKEVKSTTGETAADQPLFSSTSALSNNREELITLIITNDGRVIPDDINKILNQKAKFDNYILKENTKSKENSGTQENQTIREISTENFRMKSSMKLIPIFKNGLCGFCDESRNIVISCMYEQVLSFSNGLAAVEVNGKYGFIDHFGEQIIPFIYDSAKSFKEGLALVSMNDWSGFINRNGNRIIDVGESNYSESFSEGLAVVSDYWGNYFGFIDRLGKLRIPTEYNFVASFSSGLAIVHQGEKRCFINHYGEEVIQLHYDGVESFSEGLALVSKNNKWGFIDQCGHEVIPLIYDEANSFSEGLASVKLDDRWGYIDNSGFIAIPLIFSDAESFSEGLALVSKNDEWGCCLWGMIDRFVNEVIQIKYNEPLNFSEGLAFATSENWFGYIDRQGKHIIPLKYHDGESLWKGVARVKLNNKWGLINTFGNEITPIKYDSIILFGDNENTIHVHLNEKVGVIDIAGKEITPIKYDSIDHFYNGYAKVKLNGKDGKIDSCGNEYWVD